MCVVERIKGSSWRASTRATPKERCNRPTCLPDLGRGVTTLFKVGRLSRHHPNPQSQSSVVTETPKQPEVTTTRKTAKPKKLTPKPTGAPKPVTVKTKKQAGTNVKTVADKPKRAKVVVPTYPHSRIPLTSSTNFPLTHVCIWLVGYSRQSLPFLPGRPARGETSKSSFWKWQHVLGRRSEEKLCASPARMHTGCTAGSLNWSTFSSNMVSIYASEVRHP